MQRRGHRDFLTKEGKVFYILRRGIDRAVVLLTNPRCLFPTDVSGLDSTMTIEELESEIAKQKKELDSVNERLGDVKSEGRKLVSAEDIIQSELLFKQALGSWERYRHSFRSIWDLISENLEDNQVSTVSYICLDPLRVLRYIPGLTVPVCTSPR